VPEEEMSEHARKDMVMPAPEFPNLIVIHTQFRFGFFKALFYGPPKTAEPNERRQSGTYWGIAQKITV
jgi:hypothetical protein